MRVLIVYAHPSAVKGHNAQVRKRVERYLAGRSIDYKVIDLYRDGFDPMLPEAEWEDHRNVSPQVAGYQDEIRKSDRLVFIYPVWWYTYPAILKGFFDRVFTPGFAYNMRKVPLWMTAASSVFRWFLSVRTLYPVYNALLPVTQHLRGKKALVINTFGGDESGFRIYGHAPQYAADRAVLEFCGVSPVYRVHWYNLRKSEARMPPEVEKRIDAALGRLCS